MEMLKVLIVDDDPLVLKVLEMEFKNCGVKPQLASNAMEAQIHLARIHFDIVMLDLIMPAFDGASLAEAERLSGETDTEFIAISAATAAKAREMMGVGIFDRFEPKPITQEKVREIVELRQLSE